MRFSIITGLSGAGRSCALKTFEDMGFYCTDNIPPALLPQFAELCISRSNATRNIAVVADMRLGEMFEEVYPAIQRLRMIEDLTVDIIYLDADDEVLISRFKQTRRAHPLSGSGRIIEGIRTERESTQRIKEMANIVIDTSLTAPKDLAKALKKRFGEEHDSRLLISVQSFGYKRGVPMDADLVFDVRFIPNPFYFPDLRRFSGLEKKIQDFVYGFEVTQKFLKTITDLVVTLAPSYVEQDKHQLVIGIGCTGGMHRSVAVSEELYRRLQDQNMRVTLEHRDLVMEETSIKMRFKSE